MKGMMLELLHACASEVRDEDNKDKDKESCQALALRHWGNSHGIVCLIFMDPGVLDSLII